MVVVDVVLAVKVFDWMVDTMEVATLLLVLIERLVLIAVAT